MSVFIELTTEPFEEVFTRAKDVTSTARRAGAADVRRPLRGLEIKDDTYAIIKVVRADGGEIELIDSGSQGGRNAPGTSRYTNFILQSVQEARMEKNQIVETFGESYIFFFGEAPRFLDVTAVLLNSNDFNWEAEFWANYEQYFRGSKLTELGARLYLFYDDNIVEGYMLQAQAMKIDQNPLWVQMSFRLFVTNYTNISFVESDDFPVRASVDLPPGIVLTDTAATSALSQLSDALSAARGQSELAAQIAIQEQAISQFGVGTLLTQALRQGLNPALALQLGNTPGFLADPSAAVGLAMDASVSIGGEVSVGTPIFSTASYNAASPVPSPFSFGFPTDSIFGPGFNPYVSGMDSTPAQYPVELQRDQPLRGKIWQNTDEWTGTPIELDGPQYESPNMTDVEDLPYASILMLGAYGAELTSINDLGALGMAPRFTPPGIGIGAGVGVSATAQFGFSAGVSAGVGVGIGYGVSSGVGTGYGPTGPYAGSFMQNGVPSDLINASPVPYPNYPGFGAGYGSGNPGLLGGYSPGGGLGFGLSSGVSAGASFGGGVGVGAAVLVGGPATCFALESFPGELVISGDAFVSSDGTVILSEYTSGPEGSTFAIPASSL